MLYLLFYVLMCVFLIVEFLKLQISVCQNKTLGFKPNKKIIIKNKAKLNKGKYKSVINFSNLKLYVNGRIVKNFKQGFNKNYVKFFKVFSFGVLVVKFYKNNLFVFNNFSQEKTIKVLCFNHVKNPKIKLLKGDKCFKIKTKTYCKFSNFKVVNFLEFSSKSFCVNLFYNRTTQSAMQNKIYGFNSCDFLKLNNSNNKNFINCFLSNFKQFKIYSNCDFLNNLVNNVLKNKIKNYVNNISEQDLRLFVKIDSDFNSKFVVNHMLKNKKYIDLFNYIFCNVLGVVFLNDSLMFLNNSCFNGQFKIEYKGEFFVVSNINGVKSVLYNGIVYNNISVIKLQSINNFKFDNLNYMC